MLSDNQLVPLLTVREASRLLYINSNTLRRWSDRGIIKAYRVNHRGDRRYRPQDIDNLLSELKANGGSPKKLTQLPVQSHNWIVHV